jgi:hypothetical protein
MPDSICSRFTFFGYIPDGSDKQHIGIVLGTKEELLKYCYCTSKFARIYNEYDFIKIPAIKMRKHFNNPQDTYIFISSRHIFDMFVITFKSKLGSEYEIKPLIDEDIYISILSKIQNSDNLPERFKNEFFQFLE